MRYGGFRGVKERDEIGTKVFIGFPKHNFLSPVSYARWILYWINDY